MTARHRRTSSDGALGGGGHHPAIAPVPLLGIDPAHEDVLSLVDRRSDYYRRTALEHHLQDAAAASVAAKKGRGGGAAARAPPRAAAPAPSTPQEPLLTLPNVLTFARLVFVPVVGLLWYSPNPNHPLAAALLFVAASLTDWLDGYLARRLELTSAFGAFLDPVADKVMVSTALVLLATTPPAPLTPQDLAAPVVIIIAREITISALREWAAAAASGGGGGGGSGGGVRAAVKVNSLGKWKTALQMAAMSALMLGRDRSGKFQAALDAAARLVGGRPLGGGAGGSPAASAAATGGGSNDNKAHFTSTLARAFGSINVLPAGPAAIPTSRPSFGAPLLRCARRAFTVEAVVWGAWVALWGAALLAVWSGAVYFRAAWSAFFETVTHPEQAVQAQQQQGTPVAAPRLAVPGTTPLTDAVAP
jgi:CDP-diacylglycerol--glycerol-3-phosphate 3-phosphatidyltransferase